MIHENLSISQSLSNDKAVQSNKAYIIKLGEIYYSCSWDSKWVIINKVVDTEQENITDPSEETFIHKLSIYEAMCEINESINFVEEYSLIQSQEFKAHHRSVSPGDSGVDESCDSETEKERSTDQFSETSEESSCYELEKHTINTNIPLVINQCLEVFKQLSLSSIVNRHSDIVQ